MLVEVTRQNASVVDGLDYEKLTQALRQHLLDLVTQVFTRLRVEALTHHHLACLTPRKTRHNSAALKRRNRCEIVAVFWIVQE